MDDWTCVKKDHEKKYREIDLYNWEATNEMRLFVTEEIENLKSWMLIEVEDGEGRREIRHDPKIKACVKVTWCLKGSELQISFPACSVTAKGSCIGHLYLCYKGTEGMKYHLPDAVKQNKDKDGRFVYSVRLGEAVGVNDISIKGDKYFDSLFTLQHI